MESTLEYQAKVYYKPSGRFSPAGPLAVLLIGGFIAALGALIYSYLIHWLPFVYLNFLLTLFFAFALGIGTGVGVYFGHIRNTFIALLAGLLVGVFAEYAVWVVHFYAGSARDIPQLDPMRLWANIIALAEKGSWTMFGFKPAGAWLYSIWGLEAAVIIGSAGLLAYGTASNPYCEDCGKWADEEDILGPFETVEDKKELVRQLEHRNYAMLEDLEPANNKKKYTNLKIDGCPSCGRFHVLAVQKVKAKKNKGGEPDIEEEDIVSGLILAESDYHRLMNSMAPEDELFMDDTGNETTGMPDEKAGFEKRLETDRDIKDDEPR